MIQELHVSSVLHFIHSVGRAVRGGYCLQHFTWKSGEPPKWVKSSLEVAASEIRLLKGDLVFVRILKSANSVETYSGTVGDTKRTPPQR